MPRIHFFEFEDLPWFPPVVRELMTDHLSFMAEQAKDVYRPFTEKLRQALASCKEHRLIDLCTGGGGPARTLAGLLRDLGTGVEVLMTDLYPNHARLQLIKDRSAGNIDFCPDSVDATRVPPPLSGFRLLCNSFHHFRKEQARAILADAVEQRQGIAVFEVLERSLPGLVQAAFVAGMAFLSAPFIRPFRLSRLLLTYVLPAVPLFLLWDGTVSCLRIYSPSELKELVDSLSQAGEDLGYEWEITQTRPPLMMSRVTFLIGYPRAGAVKTRT